MKRFYTIFITMLKNRSVKTKVLGMTIGLVVLMALTSTIFLREILVVKLSEDLDRRAISIASDLSSRSMNYTILKDILGLHHLLRDTMQNNPDIEYIFVVDQSSNVLIHTFGRDFIISEELLHINTLPENVEVETKQLVMFKSETGLIHDIIAPISSGNAGFIRVGLNEKQIYKTIDDITLMLIMATIFVGAIGFVIAYFLTNHMYRDLTHLIQKSKQVGAGDLDCKVNIDSKDEIGLLGKEFNRMIINLKQKEDENHQYLNVLQMRNSELSLLHQLAVSSVDIDNFSKHLKKTAVLLMEDLNLNSCFIELNLAGEKIATFQGKDNCQKGKDKSCQNCGLHLEDVVLHESQLYLPIETTSKIGQINVCFARKPDETTRKFIYSFASQLSVVAENARLWKEIKYKEELRLKLLERVITVQEEERKRISRELHDETSQSITSIIVGLTLLEEYHPSEQMKEKISDLKEVSQKTLEEIHYISWSLRPSVLDDLGLLPAIKKYVIEYMKKYDLDVDIQVIGFDQLRLSSIIEVTIYRVIQEALTNAARHAEAENISIILKHTKGIVTVIIEDDGKGFEIKKLISRELSKDHLGLKGMQERIESLGGKLLLESNKGFGTTVYVKDIVIGDEPSDKTENYAS
jgi:signal transduction histidine kinase